MTIEELISYVSTYNLEEVEKVRKAYEFARDLHSGQVRESGEPYITHPLSVAYILAEMHADGNTLCAALLHDTIEDTNITKEDIAEAFNKDVANLVDGVTKIAQINFSSKEEQNYANQKKIILSITNDVRVIIIKLADRLHNMRTLEYKNPKKQKENSEETIHLFAKFADKIGAYRIRNELEDLSLRYLNPDEYKRIEEKRMKIEHDSEDLIKDMLYKIHTVLSDNNIPNDIKVRIKNIYGIYKKLQQGKKISDIHDLIALKIIVDQTLDCYSSLFLVHSCYKPLDKEFKDYICNPKTNMYKSLHTTVFGPNGRLVQAQIRTIDMDKEAAFGLTSYWDISKGKARDDMLKDIKENYPFFKIIVELDKRYKDNKEFVTHFYEELFGERVYVYSNKGKRIELPVGSTPIDYAYEVKASLGNTMVVPVINDEVVPVDYQLQKNDRVVIITDDMSYGPRTGWEEKAHTCIAKEKIRDMNRR